MKTNVVIFFFCITIFGKINAQQMVYNDKLLFQLFKNQSVRQTSMTSFENIFKKQKEIYEDAEKNLAKVIFIQEHIYKQLYNVNSLFKQGQKVKYIKHYLTDIVTNGEKMIRLSSKYPQHSVWLKKYYSNIFTQITLLEKQVFEVLLKPNKELLLDAYDRDILIENIFHRLRQINISILAVNNIIDFSMSRPYIYSIPKIGDYVSMDKRIIEDIISKYKQFKN